MMTMDDYHDRRGPIRKIETVDVDGKSGATLLSCGHVASLNPRWVYRAGDDCRCYACKQEHDARQRPPAARCKVLAAGDAAIEAAKAGAILHVRAFDGYEPAGAGALERAERMDPHGRWIYVVLDLWVSP